MYNRCNSLETERLDCASKVGVWEGQRPQRESEVLLHKGRSVFSAACNVSRQQHKVKGFHQTQHFVRSFLYGDLAFETDEKNDFLRTPIVCSHVWWIWPFPPVTLLLEGALNMWRTGEKIPSSTLKETRIDLFDCAAFTIRYWIKENDHFAKYG